MSSHVYAAIFALVLTACATPDVPEPPVRPVRTVVVERSGGAMTGSFSGTTRSGDEATLSFRSAGTLMGLDVATGDRVQAGDVLAHLDASDLRLQLQQAQASVAQAEANAQLARRTLERVEQLYVDDNASAADVDNARAQAASAEAGLASAVQQRSLARRNLEAAQLVATRSGTISAVLVNANENVGAGTPILVLTPDEALQVTVAVPTDWLERLAPGTATSVRLPDLKADVPARVTEVGGAQTAGSFPVTVQLEEQRAALRAGLVAEVLFSLPDTGESQIELPLSAVGEDADGRHVWVVGERDAETGHAMVSRQSVQTGALTADGLVVTGLEPGVVVVTAGLSKLFEGRVVRVDAPSAGVR